MTIVLPPDVLDMRDRGDDWVAWVDGLPEVARDLVDEWGAGPFDGAPMARVLLARACRSHHRWPPAVLKHRPRRRR